MAHSQIAFGPEVAATTFKNVVMCSLPEQALSLNFELLDVFLAATNVSEY